MPGQSSTARRKKLSIWVCGYLYAKPVNSMAGGLDAYHPNAACGDGLTTPGSVV